MSSSPGTEAATTPDTPPTTGRKGVRKRARTSEGKQAGARGPGVRGQVGALLRAAHPRQAVAFAVVVGALCALMGRPLREVGLSALVVLLSQLALGLVDDVVDIEVDRRSGATGKPLAEERAARGNATFLVAALVIVLVPLSLQLGTAAGLFLLGTLVVGWVQDRWLQGTPLSWLGWAATFALLTCFVAYGGWAHEAVGTAPVTTFLVLATVLGVLVHFLTTLPDLVEDNEAGVRSLPLRVALRTGAPRLLVVTAVLTVAAVAALAWTALTVGIAR
jgi:4-hydroxybenzoate polyprenyltransferase